jgi:ABC-type multidrug transport system permease subunit
MFAGLLKNLSSKKFFACIFSISTLGIMGIWVLYKLPDSLATQAFGGVVFAITAVFTAFCTGNVIGDHVYGTKNIDKDKKDA